MTSTQSQQSNGKTEQAWQATRDWVKDQSAGTLAAIVLVPAAVVTASVFVSKRARRGAKRAVRKIKTMATNGGGGSRRGRSRGRTTSTTSQSR